MVKTSKYIKKLALVVGIGYLLYRADEYFAKNSGLFIFIFVTNAFLISSLSILFIESVIIRKPRILDTYFIGGASLNWREYEFLKIFKKKIFSLLLVLSVYLFTYSIFSKNIRVSIIEFGILIVFAIIICIIAVLFIKFQIYPISKNKSFANTNNNMLQCKGAFFIRISSIVAKFLTKIIPEYIKPFSKRKVLYFFREQFSFFILQYLLIIITISYVIIQKSHFFTYFISFFCTGYIIIILNQISKTEMRFYQECSYYGKTFYRFYFSELSFYYFANIPIMLLFIYGNYLLGGLSFLTNYIFYENIFAMFIIIYLGVDDFLMKDSKETNNIVKIAGYLSILWVFNLFEIKGLFVFLIICLWFFYDISKQIIRSIRY